MPIEKQSYHVLGHVRDDLEYGVPLQAIPTLFSAALLFADAGVPMIVFTLPAMVCLLIPIIAVEAYLCKRWLGISTWDAFKSNIASNVASTLVGVPIAWAATFGLEMFVFATAMQVPTLQRAMEKWNSPIASAIVTVLSPAWLGPDEKNLYWMVPLAATVLLVPSFFASFWIELFVVRRILARDEDDQPLSAAPSMHIAVRNANLVTYGLLVLGTTGWLLISFLKHSR